VRSADSRTIAESLRRPPAFEAVFTRHYEAVHRYAQRRVGVDAADEIAAETFLQAFDNRSRFDPAQPSARPWLLGIATNLMRRRWRDERRQLAAYERTLDEAAAGSAAADPPAHDVGRDLAVALASLTGDDRDALLLFVWADLSYQEIGDALAVPIGTVRSRISRARRCLRERLAPRSDSPQASRECSPLKAAYIPSALAEEPHDG
jgi:RNA polymerase sigma factor (sigma-70 family)